MSVADLNDKWILVTGAASGIGLATAKAFASRGANVIVSDIDAAGVERAAVSISKIGRQCIAQAADVSSEASVVALADEVHTRIAALDVLVNNAGIAYLGSFLETPATEWQRTIDINLMGVVHGCRAFLPRMIAAGGSRRIVNVASLAAVAPVPSMSAYAASKSAVLGLCEVLSMELSKTGVGVTAVCPGIINTPITGGRRSTAFDDAQLALLQHFYKTKGAAPERVAAAIVAAVVKGRELVLSGPGARPMYHLKRVSRALVRKLSLESAEMIGFSRNDALAVSRVIRDD